MRVAQKLRKISRIVLLQFISCITGVMHLFQHHNRHGEPPGDPEKAVEDDTLLALSGLIQSIHDRIAASHQPSRLKKLNFTVSYSEEHQSALLFRDIPHCSPLVAERLLLHPDSSHYGGAGWILIYQRFSKSEAWSRFDQDFVRVSREYDIASGALAWKVRERCRRIDPDGTDDGVYEVVDLTNAQPLRQVEAQALSSDLGKISSALGSARQ